VVLLIAVYDGAVSVAAPAFPDSCPVLIPLFTALLLQPVLDPVDAAMTAHQQQKVRQAVHEGRIVPLERVLSDALRRYPGTLVEVELDDGNYEIEILGGNGVIMELEYEAASGRFRKIEQDD
jgi:hypothetical protein